MMIAHPYYFDAIKVNDECPETLVVERPDYLRSIVSELVGQQKNGMGGFVISYDNMPVDFVKNVYVMSDLFQLDFENRQFKTRIQSHLENVNYDSAEGAQLVSRIKQFASELCDLTQYPVSFDYDFTINELIKF